MRSLPVKFFVWCVFGVLFVGSCVVLFQLARPAKPPLMIVSSDPKFRVSIGCTVGTNHAYYIGGLWGRVPNPLTHKEYLRCNTDQKSTVIWVRFSHPSFGAVPTTRKGPPQLFNVRLMRSGGEVVPLTVVDTGYQDFKHRYFVTGWVVPGPLEKYGGSLVRIESTNGNEVVTFRVR